MKSFLGPPVVRGTGFAILAALMLTRLSSPADVGKGAARQRQLAQQGFPRAVSTPPTVSRSGATVRPTDQGPNETVVLTTGSHLPTLVRKRILITNGGLNVNVVDRRQIERTGATSVTGAIRRLVP